MSDLVDDVSDSTFTELGVASLLSGDGRHHQRGHVDAATSTEKAPEQRRQQRHDGHHEQDQRHPLVIGDYLSFLPLVVFYVRYSILYATRQHQLIRQRYRPSAIC